MSVEKWYSIDQVAAILNVSEEYVATLTKEHKLFQHYETGLFDGRVVDSYKAYTRAKSEAFLNEMMEWAQEEGLY